MACGPNVFAERLGVKEFILKVQYMQADLLAVLFPDHMKTHRHNWRLCLILASIMTIQGILYLRTNSHLPWVQRVAHIAVEPMRRILLNKHLTEDIVSTALVFLRQGLEGHGFDEEACVYSLFSSHSWYIGKALLQRRNSLGIPSRIMEHVASILRRSGPASRSIRAVLLRQRPAHTLGFILLKRGDHHWIKVSEAVAIRALATKANARPLDVRTGHGVAIDRHLVSGEGGSLVFGAPWCASSSCST